MPPSSTAAAGRRCRRWRRCRASGLAAVAAASIWSSVAAEGEDGKFSYTAWSAAKRSEYYLGRAGRFESGSPACRRLAQAAVDISPDNGTVASLAAAAGCSATPSGEPPSLQVGPTASWARVGEPGEACDIPAGMAAHDVFGTALGFTHLADVGLRDWKATLAHLRDESIKRFERASEAEKRPFLDVNNDFFKQQILDPVEAKRSPQDWPEMYGSQFYDEWTQAARRVCTSYLRKTGTPLSEDEEERIEVVAWAAVYPQAQGDVVGHLYHAHQESIVSFVLYVAMPEPTTPMTVADPRGTPPVEDYEWYQNFFGSRGVDAEPPFHRTLEFFAGEGDILIFPSYAIHKVPPHIGRGTRVAWPANCHLPKVWRRRAAQHPLDGWERTVRWPAPGQLRPGAAPAYLRHTEDVLAEAFRARDPFMKAWEALNQIVAFVQSDASSAETWLTAGNLTAQLAVLLASRGEGDYFPDALAFWARALRMDSSLDEDLDDMLESLDPDRPPRRLREGYEAAERWVKKARKWNGAPPEEEKFVQFLDETASGLGQSEASIARLQTKHFFSSRVLVARAPRPEADLKAAAAAILGQEVLVQPAPPLDACWRRHDAASLVALACPEADGGGGGGRTIWLADPRGLVPEAWAAAVPMRPPRSGCSGEPKAPFHRHRSVACGAGEALLLPAWLPYQVPPESRPSVRPFLISATAPHGPAGWSVPPPRPLCRGGAPPAPPERRASPEL